MLTKPSAEAVVVTIISLASLGMTAAALIFPAPEPAGVAAQPTAGEAAPAVAPHPRPAAAPAGAAAGTCKLARRPAAPGGRQGAQAPGRRAALPANRRPAHPASQPPAIPGGLRWCALSPGLPRAAGPGGHPDGSSAPVPCCRAR